MPGSRLAFLVRTVAATARAASPAAATVRTQLRTQTPKNSPARNAPRRYRGYLPEVVSATKTNLPLEVIPAGRTIDDSTPDQLALLRAVAIGSWRS
jgi:hypothetical protein